MNIAHLEIQYFFQIIYVIGTHRKICVILIHCWVLIIQSIWQVVHV